MVSVAATFIGSRPPWKKEQSASGPALEVMRCALPRGREAEVGRRLAVLVGWRNGWGGGPVARVRRADSASQVISPSAAAQALHPFLPSGQRPVAPPGKGTCERPREGLSRGRVGGARRSRPAPAAEHHLAEAREEVRRVAGAGGGSGWYWTLVPAAPWRMPARLMSVRFQCVGTSSPGRLVIDDVAVVLGVISTPRRRRARGGSRRGGRRPSCASSRPWRATGSGGRGRCRRSASCRSARAASTA